LIFIVECVYRCAILKTRYRMEKQGEEDGLQQVPWCIANSVSISIAIVICFPRRRKFKASPCNLPRDAENSKTSRARAFSTTLPPTVKLSSNRSCPFWARVHAVKPLRDFGPSSPSSTSSSSFSPPIAFSGVAYVPVNASIALV